MTRWILGKAALLALYVGYVAWLGEPSWLLVVIALASATGVLAAGDEPVKVRGALAAGTLVMAVLHARALDGLSPWSAVQLGLAAAVAASSVATLLAARMGGRAATSLVVTLAVGAVVLGLSAPDARLGIAFVMFAALRPLGAVGLVARRLGWHAGPIDPLLWWSPLAREVRA